MKKIDLNKNALKNFTTVRNEEKKFKKYLQKLMDKGYLTEWSYNGVYHVEFKVVEFFENRIIK